PGLRADAPGGKTDPRDRQGARPHQRAGDQGRSAARPTDAPVCHNAADWGVGSVPVQRRCGVYDGDGAAGRRRLDGAIAAWRITPEEETMAGASKMTQARRE